MLQGTIELCVPVYQSKENNGLSLTSKTYIHKDKPTKVRAFAHTLSMYIVTLSLE